MKNRKRIVVAFMLVAVMLMGVGYAAVTNVLDIQGSVSVPITAAEEEFNENIYFSGVLNSGTLVQTIDSTAGLGYTANINTNNNDKAQFTVTGISSSGDSEEITYRIQNDSEHEATVEMKTITNTNLPHFDFSYYFGTPGVITTTIPAGGYADVTVRVALIAQLTAASSASFVVELNATAD